MARRTRILVAMTGITAGGVAASLVWSWLCQPGEVEQLVEILAGKSLPDAAWAFRKLEGVSDEDLRNLVAYLNDTRPTPLKAVDREDRVESDPRGLTLARLVKHILLWRMPDKIVPMHDHRPDDSPEVWDQQRWDLEIERFLAERSGEPRTRGRKSWRVGLVRPPVYPTSFFPAEAPEYATRSTQIAALLQGGDAALAVWLVEMLRSSPDETLDGLLAHASSMEATRVRLFYSEHDPVVRARGFRLGHLVRMMLAERVENDVLYYNVRRYDTPGLTAEVEAAWVKHRGRRMDLLDRPGGEPRR